MKIRSQPKRVTSNEEFCTLVLTPHDNYNNIDIINVGDENTGTVTINLNPSLPLEYPPYVTGITCSPPGINRYLNSNNYYYKFTLDNIAPDCQINISAGLPLHGNMTTKNNCTDTIFF